MNKIALLTVALLFTSMGPVSAEEAAKLGRKNPSDLTAEQAMEIFKQDQKAAKREERGERPNDKAMRRIARSDLRNLKKEHKGKNDNELAKAIHDEMKRRMVLRIKHNVKSDRTKFDMTKATVIGETEWNNKDEPIQLEPANAAVSKLRIFEMPDGSIHRMVMVDNQELYDEEDRIISAGEPGADRIEKRRAKIKRDHPARWDSFIESRTNRKNKEEGEL